MSDPAWPDDAVEVGRIIGAWGVKGAIKVLPYLAEGAFLRRQFDEVRAHLASLHALEDGEGPVLGRLRAVMEQWL